MTMLRATLFKRNNKVQVSLGIEILCVIVRLDAHPLKART